MFGSPAPVKVNEADGRWTTGPNANENRKLKEGKRPCGKLVKSVPMEPDLGRACW